MKKSIINAGAENFRPLQFAKIVLVVGIMLAMSFTFCKAAGNPSALVGRWVEVSGETKGAVMEFLSDGTGIFTYEKTSKEAGVEIKWKTEKERFYITASGMASGMDYKLQGSQLTFTEDNGKVSVYVKCKKDCKETAKEYAEAERVKAETKAKAEAEKAKAVTKAKAEAAVKANRDKVKNGSFTDTRDGKLYKTVKLDSQTWMAENLNYVAEGSKCYDNDESNCQKFGRLYNWKTAMEACPKGWHLPSNKEWDTLYRFVDGTSDTENLYASEIAGKYLKASSGWDDYHGKSGNGTDDYGFAALPGGNGDSDGSFYNVGSNGYWWSSTESGASNAYYRNINYIYEYVNWLNFNKGRLFSVRCVQD